MRSAAAWIDVTMKRYRCTGMFLAMPCRISSSVGLRFSVSSAQRRRGSSPAALQTLVLDEAFLDGLKLVRAGLDFLDGEDLMPIDIGRQQDMD